MIVTPHVDDLHLHIQYVTVAIEFISKYRWEKLLFVYLLRENPAKYDVILSQLPRSISVSQP